MILNQERDTILIVSSYERIEEFSVSLAKMSMVIKLLNVTSFSYLHQSDLFSFCLSDKVGLHRYLIVLILNSNNNNNEFEQQVLFLVL